MVIYKSIIIYIYNIIYYINLKILFNIKLFNKSIFKIIPYQTVASTLFFYLKN
jgi:hypothetical protein